MGVFYVVFSLLRIHENSCIVRVLMLLVALAVSTLNRRIYKFVFNAYLPIGTEIIINLYIHLPIIFVELNNFERQYYIYMKNENC